MTELMLGLLPWSLEGDRREVLLYALSLAAVLTGTLLCVWALRVPAVDVLASSVASAGAAAWLLSNGPGEGSTLFEVLPRNGLTVADLVVLPAAALVAWLVLRRLLLPPASAPCSRAEPASENGGASNPFR